MKNGNDRSVIEQFNRIANLPDHWDHNQQYQEYLIKQIPKGCGRILDVGCGTGELTKKLAAFSEEVIGIDVAENMITEARRRNGSKKITYIPASVEQYLAETGNAFDVIISIAALHHMDEEKVLEQMKSKLTPNGKILILDIVEDRTHSGIFLSFIAMLLNPIMYLIKEGRLKVTAEEKAAWEGHFQYDKYLSTREVKAIAQKVLGKANVRRHLFWRYSLIYQKNL